MWSATEQSQRLVLAQDLLDSINQTLVGHGSGGHYYNTIHFVQFAVGDVLLTWGQRQQAETLWTSDLKERLEYPWSGLVAGRVQFILDCLDGKLEQALDLAGAHIQTAELLGATPFGRENAAVYLRRTQLYLGRADEALAGFHAEFETLAPGELPVAGLFGMYAAQRAVCLAHAGRHTDAQAVLDHFLSMRDPLDASDELPMPSAVALLEVATSVGDRSAAAVLTEALQVAADLVAVDGTLTVIARHLAAACALDDHWDRARTYATQAMRIAEKVGFRPEAALARLQLAQLELEEGNLPEVRRLLDQTTPELVAMHMQPALEDAIALRSKSAATIR
jgi:tetratricopeptide (TPR) repeat protein